MKIAQNKLIFTQKILIVFCIFLFSCVPNVGKKLRTRANNANNKLANVNSGQGWVLEDNPVILSKNSEINDTFDLNKLLSTAFITDGNYLNLGQYCDGINLCFEIKENQNSNSSLQSLNGEWAYRTDTSEFLQVNNFYHLKKIYSRFYDNLEKSLNFAYANLLTRQYNTALPLNIFNQNKLFNIQDKTLTSFADCDLENNAEFSPSQNTLCFGYITGHENAKWAQDSTIIYHEAGHFFQKIQLNLRNKNTILKADLGTGKSNEGQAIGEGLSDFYSYYINGRPHFGEWAAGTFFNVSRPLKENDPQHLAPGLSLENDQRLSYPQYLNYLPSEPSVPSDDIHNNGMIISHYLVALTEDLEAKCNFTKIESSNHVMHFLNETLAELGDLTTKGTENNLSGLSKVNLNSLYSYEWATKVNPINYRSFMQTFAKNILNYLGNPNLNKCNGNIYTKDQIESLIDMYGLLLFRTYNENRNFSNPGVINNTLVNSLNRKKSTFITKNQVIFDPRVGAPSAFVIDDKKVISKVITDMQSVGVIGTLSGITPSNLGFNNNNGKVSPGEVVGLFINLFNNSNSTIAGMQILANDWNQADSAGKPCLFTNTLTTDRWPIESEGGVPCNTISANSNLDFAPICFIQNNENNGTKWIGQSDFKTKMGIENSQCLDPLNDKNCFIRAIKGADSAYFSKLNPKANWSDTLINPKDKSVPSPSFSQMIFFEVSKHIPPGTIVDCRMRVRFTNCDDCFHDSSRSYYDFKDVDYNGPKPYKIIHLQIPIID